MAPITAHKLIVLVFACVSLAGCGFRPLNAAAGIGGADAETKLANVQIAPIPGRLGQRLRNELVFNTTGGAAATTEPLYRLEIAVRESTAATLVKTDGDAQSQIYNADATFNLIRLSDKKVVLKGESFGRAGLERNPSIFSNTRAVDDAQNRTARSIATELKTRIAAFLATNEG